MSCQNEFIEFTSETINIKMKTIDYKMWNPFRYNRYIEIGHAKHFN